jgi:hypothetical protein
MLRGLPLSKKLGWWSTHSGRSFPCSSISGTSCAWISCGSVPACSSYTATCTSTCNPVWCIGISEYAIGASCEMTYDDHNCMQCSWTCLTLSDQLVQNSSTRYSTSSKNMYHKYMSSTAFSSITDYHYTP